MKLYEISELVSYEPNGRDQDIETVEGDVLEKVKQRLEKQ